MTVNSRQKGARGEREAAKYLTKLGFPCKRMGRNGYSDADLKGIEECLPNVHVEVKFGVKGMDLNTAVLKSAYSQAWDDRNGRVPVVLWKPPYLCWRLTWFLDDFGFVTVAGDDDIAAALRDLNNRP